MHIHENYLSRAAATFSPEELRRQFLVSGLFQPGELKLHWWETDRTVLGAAIPLAEPLALPTPEGLRSAYFLERREMGVINIGGPGTIRVDAQEFTVAPLDAVYLGRGGQRVTFASADPANPAKYWLLSYPAHTAYPHRQVAHQDVAGDRLGGPATSNERILRRMIHPGTMPTCQVVMGVTSLQPGSVWNSMPPHTHLRRSEVYLYFGVPQGQAVFHFMGQPQETRHLVMHEGDAVLSPPWSIHCGCGTTNYSFIWGMGGENQVFSDMDPAPVGELR